MREDELQEGLERLAAEPAVSEKPIEVISDAALPSAPGIRSVRDQPAAPAPSTRTRAERRASLKASEESPTAA